MEKIKFFILTLLCMVGVMHVYAQDVVVKNIGETDELVITVGESGTGILGNDDRTQCSWISKNSYDAKGNSLVIDDNGTQDRAIGVNGENLSFGVTRAHDITIRIFAPFGWVIEGYDFYACHDNKDVTVTAGTKSGKLTDKNTEEFFSQHGIGDSFVSFVLHTDEWGGLVSSLPTVYFRDFKVTVKKVGEPTDVINSFPESTVDGGHWIWKQEIPTPGNSYKIVNGSTPNNTLAVMGQKNNEVAKDKEKDEIIVTDKIENGGEWRYGLDYKLTNFTTKEVGFYQTHVSLLGNEIGFKADTQWRISPLAVSGISGFSISNKPALVQGVLEYGRLYLMLSEDLVSVDNEFLGKLWRSDNCNSKAYVWNFYSSDQYNCYISYKEAYEEFMKLDPEQFKDEPYFDTYGELLAEIRDYPAKGYDKDTRDETYDRIRRMLDLIATIKMDYPSPDPENPSGLENPEAEKGIVDWTYTPTGTGTPEASATSPAFLNQYKFEIRNNKMSQEVTNLIPGVYHVSVYWKADEGSVIDFAAEGVYDKQNVVLVGNGGDDWQKATLEVVVVTGKRLTVSAAAKTGTGKAYLDDFKLDYFSQNYYYDDAATKTRMYKGVFNAKQLTPKTNVDNKYIDKNIEKEFKCNTDNDFVATVDKDYPYADITNLAFYSKFKFDNSANPNGLVYAKPYAVTKEGTTTLADNVIIAGKDGLECEKLVLQNGYPYSTKWNFTANNAEYTMDAFGVGKDDTDAKKVAYGTLILPYDVDAETINANGVVVYKPTAIDEKGHLTLQKSNTISADVPYIVQYTDAEAEKKLFEAFSTSKTVKPCDMVVDGGYLVGTYERTKVPYADGNCYLLQLQNGKLAFYPVKKDGLYCNPFRCYLKLPAGTNPSKVSLVFEDGETTGVAEIENAVCADEIYDLSGCRVENMSRPGVYVKNGKKVLVK